METTIKITENQKRALELVKELADQGKITASQAVALIMGIYENEKETIYIPYSTPDPYPYPPYVPYAEPNYPKITCFSRSDSTSTTRDDMSNIYAHNRSITNKYA